MTSSDDEDDFDNEEWKNGKPTSRRMQQLSQSAVASSLSPQIGTELALRVRWLQYFLD